MLSLTTQYHLPPSLKHRGILIFIALSLAVTFSYNTYMFVYTEAPPHASRAIFQVFSGKIIDEFSSYKQNVIEAWRPRILATLTAGRFVPKSPDDEAVCKGIGLWQGTWLFLCLLLYIISDSRQSLVLMFGTFAALYYGYTPITGLWTYPWDMPALFFFAIIYVAHRLKNPFLLISVIYLGIGFKETVILGSIVLLFWDEWPWRTRVINFGLTITGCILIKTGLNALVGTPSLLFTMDLTSPGPIALAYNLPGGFVGNVGAWLIPQWNHPIFINAGTFIIFLLLPIQDKGDLAWKIIGILFLIGNMFCGIITEYRIFYEMIPISIWALLKYISTFGTSMGFPIDRTK